MRKRLNRKGFSMAEVLIVVAIIIVLMGVGFVALMSHMRNMHQLEMDGHAKEIFVAAQNHLSMAKSQEYLGLTNTANGGDFGKVSPLSHYEGEKEVKDEDSGIFYFVVGSTDGDNPDGNTVLNQLLPFASMDEAARTGGSYIIRYQKDPGIVLDVFYAEKGDKRYAVKEGLKSADYETLMNDPYYGDAGKEKRRNYGDDKAVVGWYGGGTAGVPAGEKLNAPGLEIFNGDKLEVKVTDYNGTSNDGNELALIIKSGTTSLKIQLIGTSADTDANKDRVTKVGSTYTVVLDDVTENSRHFANLMATAAGSNIQVVATAYNNKYITNIAESPKLTTNSLFASYNESTKTVEIASIRHLLNLDTTISYMPVDVANNISVAKQISDLVWDDGDATNKGSFLDNTHEADTQIYPYSGSPSAKGSYMPVNPPSGLAYQGQSGTNHITGITVTGVTGDAGLFSSLNSGSVSNLELVDFNISASGNVGALAGSASGTTITSVLVHNSKIGGAEGTTATAGADKEYKIMSTSAAAGGLIGEASGNVTVTNCAAAVYVAADSDAGGLIGTANTGNLTVESSYSGGHTENAKYETLTPTVGTKTVVNVQSATGNAGGLIGQASGGLEIKYSYSTASASSEGGSVGIGGLVGKTADGAEIENCYAVGLVTGPADTSAKISPFVAIGNLSTSTGNYYLTSVSPMANVTPGAGVTAVSSGDTASGLIRLEGARGDAIPYDATLTMNYKGKYFFPTVAQLHGSGWTGGEPGITNIHYGDWQVPGLVLVDYLITNGNTLDLKIGLKDNVKQITLAVTGQNSNVTRTYLLEATWTTAADNSKSVTALTVQKEGAVKNNTAIVWNAAAPSSDPFAGRVTYGGWERVEHKDKTTEDVFVIHISLDDITKLNGQFAKLFANDSVTIDSVKQNLFPGEKITVRVGGGEAGWPELSELKDYSSLTADEQNKINETFNYCPKTDSSLFAKDTALSGSGSNAYYNAQIINIRHLQNLDSAVSDVAAVVKAATLQADINWTSNWNENNDTEDTEDEEIDTIHTWRGEAVEAGKFNGIYNQNLLYFYGNDKTITDLAIGATVGITSSASSAALFRTVPAGSNLTVNNLHLKTPVIESSSVAAAIVAENSGTVTLNTVLAEGAAASVSGGTTAGGLVGTSEGMLTINNSAASVYVTAGAADTTSVTRAGGLLGYQSAGTVDIKNSYVGGHTVGGAYYVAASADEGDKGRWNIISYHGAAGGLIGETASGSTLGLEKTFSSASVYSGLTTSYEAGGIIGKAMGTVGITENEGTRGAFDLVYTVAPVNTVAKNSYTDATMEVGDRETNGNGAAIGVLGKNTTTAHMFYLADIYEGTKYNQQKTKSTVCYVGSGTPATISINAQIAFYFAEQDEDNEYTYARLIGKLYPESLVEVTSAYDEKLKESTEKTKEYPFSVWTVFPTSWVNSTGNDKREFFGDWQPAKNEGSIMFKFRFLIDDPANAEEDSDGNLIMPIASFGKQTEYYQMGIQLEPFEEDKAILPIPTIPYIPGYNYGNQKETNGYYVWTVYYGDLSSEESGIPKHGEAYFSGNDEHNRKLSTIYTEVGGSVPLHQADLQKAHNEGGDYMTLVAHYYKLDDQYILKLMDYNPLDGSPAHYKNLAGIQLLDKKTKLQDAVDDEAIYIPRRSRTGYRFLGWYDAPDTLNADGTTSNSGSPVFSLNEDGKTFSCPNSEPTGDLIVYAHFEKIEKISVIVNFTLLDANNNPSSLGKGYTVSFDRNQGLHMDIALPGTVKGVKVGKTMTENGTESIIYTAPNAHTDTSEAWFVAETGVKDSAVHLNANSNYPYSYNVYIKGSVDTVYYAVVHMLEKTAVSGTELAYANTTEPAQYTVTYQSMLENATPGLDYDNDLLTETGFSYKNNTIYADTSESFATMRTKYGVEQTYDSKAVKYIFVVTYERDQYLLDFTNTGDSFFSAEWVYYDQPIKSVLNDGRHNPTYSGNKFNGWASLDDVTIYAAFENEVLVYSGDKMPAQDLTVKARWLGEPVHYTVMIWVQNADNDNYSFVDSKTLEAQSGATVAVTADRTSVTVNPDPGDETVIELASLSKLNSTESHNLYRYIHVSTDSDHLPDNNVVIRGDNATYINVYYDRDVYTLRFDIGFARRTSTNNNTSVYEDAKKTVAEAIASMNGLYAYVGGDDNATQLTNDYVYKGRNNTNFLAAVDTENGKPYGVNGSGEYIPLELRGTVTAQYYKPLYQYEPNDVEDEARDLYYLDTDGYYKLLERHEETEKHESTYTAVDAADLLGNTGGTYYVKVGDEYVAATYGGTTHLYTDSGSDRVAWISQETRYSVTTANINGANETAEQYRNDETDKSFKRIYYKTDNPNKGWYEDSEYKTPYTGTTRYRVAANNQAGVLYVNGVLTTVSHGNTELRYWTRDGVVCTTVYNIFIGGSTLVGESLYSLSGPATTTTYYWTPVGSEEKYTGTRYLRQDYSGSNVYYTQDQLVTDTLYFKDTEGQYGGANGYILMTESHSDKVQAYYLDNVLYEAKPVYLYLITGPFFTRKSVDGTWQYSVSTTTGSYYGTSDRWGTWLTDHDHRVDLGTANPFGLKYYSGYYDTNEGTTPYMVFYYEITGKYDQNIMEKYPGRQANQSNNYFVGWLSQENAYFTSRYNTSIKGVYETISEDLILTSNTNPANHNTTYPNTSKLNYWGVSVDDTRVNGTYHYNTNTATGEEGITHEFRCRYTAGGSSKPYLYRIFLADPDTLTDPDEPSIKTPVVGGSGSNPNLQTPPSITGYTLKSSKVLNSAGTPSNPGGTYSKYTIPELAGIIDGQGMIMEFRYSPNPHTVTMYYVYETENGATLTKLIKTQNRNYGQALAGFAAMTGTTDAGNTDQTKFVIPANYSTDGNWYDNPDCKGDPLLITGDSAHNAEVTMPDSNVVLYTKLVHRPVTVTFNAASGYLEDGATAVNGGALPEGTNAQLTVNFGSTLDSEAKYGNELIGIFNEGGDVKDAYIPTLADYTFKGWCYLVGEEVHKFSDVHKIYSETTLYPLWAKETEAAERKITVKYQLINYDNQVLSTNEIRAQDVLEYRDSNNNILWEYAEGAVKIKDGDRVSLTAPNIQGLDHVNMTGTIYRVSESTCEIVFQYRNPAWTYSVEYYVQYATIDDMAGWVASAAAGVTIQPNTVKSTPIQVYKAENVTADSQYVLFGYSQPSVDKNEDGKDDLAWLSKYCFDHYIYKEQESNGNYISLDPTGTVLKVYLVPDVDAIEIEDIVLFYNGLSRTDYSSAPPIQCPSEAVAQVVYKYYCYDAEESGYVLSDADHTVVNAGTYGVRAYLTVTVDSKTFVIWQSDNGSDVNKASSPPLHLYIRRRLVIMKSDTPTPKKYDGSVLMSENVTTPTSITINGVSVDLSAYEGGIGFVDDAANNIHEGADYVFSANSFRRIVGKTPNVFTYELWDGSQTGKSKTLADNYNFFVFYGTLEVIN